MSVVIPPENPIDPIEIVPVPTSIPVNPYYGEIYENYQYIFVTDDGILIFESL